MAQKASGKGMDSNKKILIGGLICILLGIVWTTYEFIREPNEDEKKQMAEEKKIQDEKNRRAAAMSKTP